MIERMMVFIMKKIEKKYLNEMNTQADLNQIDAHALVIWTKQIWIVSYLKKKHLDSWRTQQDH